MLDSATDVCSYELHLSYDPAVISVQTVSTTNNIFDGVFNTFDIVEYSNPGEIVISQARLGSSACPNANNSTLAVISAVAVADGLTSLDFSQNPFTANSSFTQTSHTPAPANIIVSTTGNSLPACPTDNSRCSSTNITGATECENISGTTSYCCQSGQVPNAENTACVDSNNGGSNLTACSDINPDASACQTNPFTGSVHCQTNNVEQYCCPIGQEPNAEGDACVDINNGGGNQTNDADLTVKFRLQGITSAVNSQDVYLTLKDDVPVVKTGQANPGAIISTATATATPDSRGVHTATFNGLPTGTYKLCLKAKSHLQKCFNSVSLSSGANSMDFSTEPASELVAGDVAGIGNNNQTQDNIISAEDIATVNAAFTDFVVEGVAGIKADINNDGRITIDDLALSILNYGYFQIPGDE
ncbi:MAG: hypothetical protein D6698_02375 [Gammaproteobacteria bacterium]|nr:MAG: hypothetical protein D6698_02375 [Gammaproteobacteria bacterium]